MISSKRMRCNTMTSSNQWHFGPCLCCQFSWFHTRIVIPSSRRVARWFCHSHLSCSELPKNNEGVWWLLLLQPLSCKEVRCSISCTCTTRCQWHGRNARTTAIVHGFNAVASTNWKDGHDLLEWVSWYRVAWVVVCFVLASEFMSFKIITGKKLPPIRSW